MEWPIRKLTLILALVALLGSAIGSVSVAHLWLGGLAARVDGLTQRADLHKEQISEIKNGVVMIREEQAAFKMQNAIMLDLLKEMRMTQIQATVMSSDTNRIVRENGPPAAKWPNSPQKN
jgi:hypothetical protein